jgi:DNA-binding NarL/FixJ family response regulator
MIRIIIADDHAIVREGMKQILSETTDIVVADEAINGQEVLQKVWKNNYDVAVLDITMPHGSGLEILEQIKKARPKLPVLILSMHPEDQYAVRALKAGAAGYLTKQSIPEELIRAIRKIFQGGKYISPTLAERLASELSSKSDKPPHETLSDREYQVMLRIASGKTVSKIAGELSLSVKTISTYRSRILDKMKMKTSSELMHYAIKNKLVD